MTKRFGIGEPNNGPPENNKSGIFSSALQNFRGAAGLERLKQIRRQLLTRVQRQGQQQETPSEEADTEILAIRRCFVPAAQDGDLGKPARAAPASSDRGDIFDGRVEWLQGRDLHGWAVNLKHPDQPVPVTVLVDGVPVARALANHFRDDLKHDSMGDGSQGFVARLPARLFDGAEHAIDIAIDGSGWQVSGAPIPTLFDRRFAERYSGAITGLRRGNLEGWTHDADEPDFAPEVELLIDGKPVATQPAEQADLIATGRDRNGHTFSIPLLQRWQSQFPSSEIGIRIVGTDFVLKVDTSHLNIDKVVIELDPLAAGQLTGWVKAPESLSLLADVDLDIWVDETFLQAVRCRLEQAERKNGGKDLWWPIACHIPEFLAAGTVRTVQVRLGGSAVPIGSPQEVFFLAPGGLVENSDFARWSGPELLHWTFNPTLADHCRPARHGPDSPAHISLADGPNLLRIDLGAIESNRRKRGDAPLGLLTQCIGPLPVKYCRGLELTISARAEKPCKLLVRIYRDGEETARASVEERVLIWPDWAQRSRVVNIPDARSLTSDSTAPYYLSLELEQGQPSWIEFSGVHLTRAGAATSPSIGTILDEELEHGALGQNALLNGNFESWSDGLSFTVGPGTAPIADEWELRNKNKSAVTVYADRALTRDLRRGDAGELRHALSISSFIETDYVRLETEIHTANLGRGCDAYLEFFAKRCNMPAYQQLSTEPNAPEVNEIFVLRRVYRDDPKDYQDEKLFTIASNVRPSRIGNRFCFRLKDSDINQICDPPRFRGDDPQAGTIILCFEFRHVIDWTFTEVRLSSTAKPQTSGALGYVGLEDPNIVGQIGRLKMIENWNCTTALTVSRDTDDANGDGDGMQAIPVFEPADSAPSVEIVICVHNAIDDVIRCLDSIRRHTTHPHSIAVIDDGSRPDVRHRLEHYISGRPWIRLIVNESNLGYTRTANLGLSRSSAEWVVLLNSDTVVTPGWLEGLFECAYSDQSIKFVGPISNAASWQSMPEISDTAGKWKVNTVPMGASVDEIAYLVRDKSNRDFPKVPLLNGFCMLMEREALETLGFFDEQAFPKGFGEENDLCVRAAEAGFKLAIADHVYIYHSKSASFGRKRRDRLSHEGKQALKRKHPDVDWDALQREMKESSVLAALRHGLRETIAAKYPLQ